MKSFSVTRFLFLALTLFVFSTFGYGQGMRAGAIDLAPDSGADIIIESAYSEVPLTGHLPLQVTIENNSGRTRSWDLATTSSVGFNDTRSVHQVTTLTVADGERKVFNLLAPLSEQLSVPHYYNRFVIDLSGYAVRGNRHHLNSLYIPGHAPQPTLVAMSPELAPLNLGKLRTAAPDFAGTSFDLTLMPPDWRAFSGFDQIWMTDNEWRATDAATRLALLDWVAMDGILYICREENDPRSLPNLGNLIENEPLTRGFGEIRTHPRQDSNLEETSTLAAIREPANSPRKLAKDLHSPSNWPLLDKLNKLKIRTTLFIGFLLLFGIVVGPVNVFVFARGSKRYRLFWTTPVISLGASIFIFALILLQDGVGGQGHQLAIWQYFPHENKAIFQQEQASRTGLLVKRDFSVDVPISLLPIQVDTIGSSTSGSFGVQQRAFSGDWFRSRSIQGHLLRGITNTRSRIEITDSSGNSPSLLSTFPFPLETIFYLDENGHWWRTENLRSGESQTLEESNKSEFDEFLRNFSNQASPVLSGEISRIHYGPGQFFVISNDAGGTWETLSTIDWETHRSFHFGPVIFSHP